jgi:hypothetical protein
MIRAEEHTLLENERIVHFCQMSELLFDASTYLYEIINSGSTPNEHIDNMLNFVIKIQSMIASIPLK